MALGTRVVRPGNDRRSSLHMDLRAALLETLQGVGGDFSFHSVLGFPKTDPAIRGD